MLNSWIVSFVVLLPQRVVLFDGIIIMFLKFTHHEPTRMMWTSPAGTRCESGRREDPWQLAARWRLRCAPYNPYILLSKCNISQSDSICQVCHNFFHVCFAFSERGRRHRLLRQFFRPSSRVSPRSHGTPSPSGRSGRSTSPYSNRAIYAGNPAGGHWKLGHLLFPCKKWWG